MLVLLCALNPGTGWDWFWVPNVEPPNTDKGCEGARAPNAEGAPNAEVAIGVPNADVWLGAAGATPNADWPKAEPLGFA